MNLIKFSTITMAVTVPTGLSETINNFMSAGQIIGGLLASIFLLIAAVQLMSGGRMLLK